MSVAEPSPAMTEHALLVPFGRFAHQIGLIDALDRVPVKMKTLAHSPGDKLAELLVHILAGGMHVKELETSPHPLIRDEAVARAWGQEAFASASGVSALLGAVSAESVAALKEEVHQVLAPYRRRLLRDLLPSFLVVDGDLTGLVVSDQAETYEGADYGYMGEAGGVAKGYQFARVQVQTGRGPLVLGGFLHPGHTVPVHCLRELVGQVEAALGRPRRRVHLVEQRLSQVERQLAAVEQALARGATSRREERLQQRRERLRAEIADLRQRRETMEAENASNPQPRRIILRLDGGFGDAPQLAWLVEQGHPQAGTRFVVRAHNHHVARRCKGEEGLRWEKVSKNGFIAPSGQTTLTSYPYPVRIFACRQWWGDTRPERWSSLLVNQELEEREWPTRRVGTFYNGRQIAEAGIKEGKGIFASRHLPTRHEAGIALYQELVLAAQNLLRWFQWQVLRRSALAATGVKDLVRRAANSRALVHVRGRALVLHFAADSSWPGHTLILPTDLSYQLCLPLLDLGPPGAPAP
ncbi:MAG: hypothetical protein JOZ41_17940 [Chloroflexi bacterium]|nr:hypothetical protein [Chloroflexota bacterium]